MPQMPEENNKPASDNTRVIKTPEGDEIEITSGRKLQQMRAFARDPDISDAQFRALVCIVDRLNEGKEGTDQSLWGSAYPTPETLAKDIAKDERAARRIVKELRDGQRETRSKSGVRSLVPCKAVLKVENRKTQDGHDDFNLMRLRSWGAFAVGDRKRNVGGAPSIAGRSPVDKEQQAGGSHLSDDGGHLSRINGSPVEDEQVTAPNSSQLLIPETQPKDPPQSGSASGALVFGSIDGSGTKPKAANDSEFQPADYNWPDDWKDQFWKAFPVRKNVKGAEIKLISLAKAGVPMSPILVAARRHGKELVRNGILNTGFCKNPVAWMDDEPWKDNQKLLELRLKSQKRTAI
ncbi:helix-turn-helix domain-containing protein [Bradyrhizobium sp. 62]|uniref:helix-turn-helix domain-containing protein n=1 Tax=Bradyrhizobium sp. 62 TaxID=1043588 RepID=UPI001FFB8579|nr:helix-turn-helix domain-containing protein [Bradyrhizobium sp. 62]MCK1366432.1 hypothetical protein [Bradyrhizobium sp. 62]